MGSPKKKRKAKGILTVFGLALAVFVGFMYYYQKEKDTVAAIRLCVIVQTSEKEVAGDTCPSNCFALFGARNEGPCGRHGQ